MFRTLWITLLSALAVLPAQAQDQGHRTELQETLQSRYRVTTLGSGLLGRRRENTIRHAGGIVILQRDGLYGSYDRGRLASNGIRDGQAEVFSGDKEVALARGEKLYVTSVYVGTDVVALGLLSARTIPSGSKNGQLWLTANFFVPKDTLEQGDVGKVYAAIDPWLLPEGIPSSPATPASPAISSPSAAPAPPVGTVELKPGMTRDEIVTALGTPLQDTTFKDHRWLTYAGMTITLEEGKLNSVDGNAQALVPVRISSDPPSADVLLDGNFVSSAPAVLRLQPGTYKIAIKLAGYSDWERTIKVLPGAEVTVHAQLSK